MLLRYIGFSLVVAIVCPLEVRGNEPPTSSVCLTLNAALQRSSQCKSEEPLVEYFKAWETTNAKRDFGETANELRNAKVIAEEHVRNGTGKQSEVDLVTIEVSVASASETEMEGDSELAVSTLLRSYGSCFQCVIYPDGEPFLTHSLPELQSLAVDADAKVISLRRQIEAIGRQIGCVRQEIAEKCDSFLHRKRCEELRRQLTALQRQCTMCEKQLVMLIEEIRKKVELMYNDFIRLSGTTTDLGSAHPSLTMQFVVTNKQKYREGTGTIDSVIEAIQRMQRAQEQATSIHLRRWRKFAELSIIISGTP